MFEFYSYKENEGIVRTACILHWPVLPALYVMYMPFYSLLQNVGCVPDDLTNFAECNARAAVSGQMQKRSARWCCG